MEVAGTRCPGRWESARLRSLWQLLISPPPSAKRGLSCPARAPFCLSTPTSTSHRATMRWPWSSSDDDDQEWRKRPISKWNENINAIDWQHYTEPRQLIPTVLLTATTLFFVRVYKSYLRRIPSVEHIKPAFFRQRSLFGAVTRVGDADNFHLFHTPGGKLAGWGWLPGRRVPTKRDELAAKTVRSASRSFIRDRCLNKSDQIGRYISASPESTPQSSPTLVAPLSPTLKKPTTG